jgi:Pyruvate/2-oxoacid:ferredoxin oxidoreductase gamma subunit
MEILGRNLANTTILGVLARAVDLLDIAKDFKRSNQRKIRRKRRSGCGSKNIQAIETAYANCTREACVKHNVA